MPFHFLCQIRSWHVNALDTFENVKIWHMLYNIMFGPLEVGVGDIFNFCEDFCTKSSADLYCQLNHQPRRRNLKQGDSNLRTLLSSVYPAYAGVEPSTTSENSSKSIFTKSSYIYIWSFFITHHCLPFSHQQVYRQQHLEL